MDTPESSTVLDIEAEDNPFTAKFEAFFKLQSKKDIERLVERYPEKRSLNIDFNSLERFDIELADNLLDNPDYVLEGARAAIKKIDVPSLEIDEFTPHLRFLNLPKDKEVLLRNITAAQLGQLVSIEGVTRQITDVLPKLKVGYWECKHCGNTYRTKQDSQIIRQPHNCSQCKHKEFTLVTEKSEFEDYQKIQIQEPLEKLRGNEQPTTLDIYVSDDLVNQASAGDKTRFVGVLRLLQPKDKKVVYGRYLECIHLEETEKEFLEVEISKEEEEQIKELAENPKIYEMLVSSIAPGIYGHEVVKEAIVLQLFGGVKKMMPDHSQIRGNIHVLLVGDPGLAKSQLLQATDRIAPKSIYVGGKTTSGVGLCVDPESLILNENGFKPIEEFVESCFDSAQAMEEIPGAFSNLSTGNASALTNRLDFVSSPIEKIWRIRAPKRMIKLETRMGRELKLTPATSLIRLKNGKTEWIKAEEIREGDFVACPRELPEGKRKNVSTLLVLERNPNIKVADPLSPWVKEITDRLIPKYGSLQAIAKAIGKSRDTVYAARNPKFFHGWELVILTKLAREAKFSDEEIVSHISTLFISHGKPFKIPKYLDNEKLGYLVGLALGDGSLSETENSSSLRIFNSNPELLENADRLIQQLFGIKPEYFNDGKRVPGIRLKYKAICDIFKEFGLRQRKTEIHLSHLATEMPNVVVGSILQGLFDTDGYVSKSKTGSSHVGLTTISSKLASTVQLTLLKFGIIAKKRFRAKAGKISKGKTITVTSKHDQYCIEIRGKQNLEQFQKQVGFQSAKKKNALQAVLSSIPNANTNVDVIPEIYSQLEELKAGWFYTKKKRNISRAKLSRITDSLEGNHFLKKLAHANIFWDEIKSKKHFFPTYEFVYDFTVKDHHNFIANGFYVHNTASAVKDDFGEGGWTLKAGALVLSSGGMAMIDEFDKMDADDRSAMHEAMEQGRVSIAKAGIVTSFKTDTSILAAANPKYGRFDPFESFLKQIDLPPTLISRFDLFFPMKDVLDRTKDAEITAHILKTHQAGEVFSQKATSKAKFSKRQVAELEKRVLPLIDSELLKKYISYARQNIFPILDKEAIKDISEFYLDLRESGRKEGSYAATHRQLEALVRLCEASARVRLSDKIEQQDVLRAINLVTKSLEELAMDRETGKIDIDIITSGRTHTQMSKMKKVLSIVKESFAENQQPIALEEILAKADSESIREDEVRDFISQLKKKGDLYEPRHGFLKPTRQSA